MNYTKTIWDEHPTRYFLVRENVGSCRFPFKLSTITFCLPALRKYRNRRRQKKNRELCPLYYFSWKTIKKQGRVEFSRPVMTALKLLGFSNPGIHWRPDQFSVLPGGVRWDDPGCRWEESYTTRGSR